MNSVYYARRQVVLKDLAAKGLSKALITKPLSICYLTGVRITPYERFYALLLDGVEKSCSFILPFLDQNLPFGATVEKKTYRDEDDPVVLLKTMIGSSDCLGIEFDAFPYALSHCLTGGSKGFRFEDVGPLLSGYRLMKSAEEIEALQTAATYSDEVYAEIATEIKPGVSEKAILSKIFQLISEREGTLNNPYVIQVLGGPNTAKPHGDAGDRRLRKGEPLTVDFGICYAYYWSDCTRTFFAGAPDPRLKAIYQIVLEAQETAISLIKPGVTAAEIDLAARRIIEKACYGEYFIHRTGHGIGLDIHELPKIHGMNENLLEVGMTFTVEPGIYIPGLGGVRIEDDVVVTQTGCRVLNSYPKDYKSAILN